MRMQTIGFIGVGKIGLPICEHLIKDGHKVIGYRRSSLADFEALGGVVAKSPADVGAQADIVFTCLPNDAALEEVDERAGRVDEDRASRSDYRRIRFAPGSGQAAIREAARRQGCALSSTARSAALPAWSQARKAVIYLAGPADAVKTLEPVIADFADLCMHLGDFGAATKVKLVNNFLVALHIAGTAQAMALGLKTGVDKDLLIKAVANGSGGSSAFSIRAPWMAERKFTPQMGSAAGLAHYLDTAKDMAAEAGVATDLLDCLIDIYARAVPNIGDRDVAAILEHFETTRTN